MTLKNVAMSDKAELTITDLKPGDIITLGYTDNVTYKVLSVKSVVDMNATDYNDSYFLIITQNVFGKFVLLKSFEESNKRVFFKSDFSTEEFDNVVVNYYDLAEQTIRSLL